MMALPRPDEVESHKCVSPSMTHKTFSALKVSRHDVETLVRDIMRQRPGGRDPGVTRSPEGDLPPKYEELGDARKQ